MSHPLTQRFIDALHRLEEASDIESISSLFDNDARLTRTARGYKQGHGVEGAVMFWRTYRRGFDRIHSEFTSIREGDNFAVLEWHGSGARNNGLPVEYDGVSVIEFDHGKIRRFATYYDSAVFARSQPRQRDEARQQGAA